MTTAAADTTNSGATAAQSTAAPGAEAALTVTKLDRVFDVSLPFLNRIVAGKPKQFLHAVNDVSFTVPMGGCLSLVGESGCGKSTVARLVTGLYAPTSGEIRFAPGKSGAPLAAQMIFQDPYASLNPRWRVKNIIAEPLRELKLRSTEAEITDRVAELLGIVGLGVADGEKFPHEFSGGQRQRISIARALASEPEFLVCDEPTSALDVSVQAQILNLMRRLQDELGLTYLFISHDLSVVRHMSDKIAVMYLGRIVEEAPTEVLFANPKHPYTQLLLETIPDIASPQRNRAPATGEVPSPLNPPSGCPFHTRCPRAEARCSSERPELAPRPDGARVACHFAMPLFKDIRKVDDFTVEIDVTSPSSLFLNDITNIFIFDADWLKNNNTETPTDFSKGVEGFATKNTNGTGPFKLESRSPDAKTVLVANEAWWDEVKHNVTRLEFIPITSAATRIAALLSGEVDLIDSAPVQDLARLEADPTVTVRALQELRTVFVAFNHRETLLNGQPNPFRDLKVRQAFEAAIDRDLINQRIMRGLARPSGSLIAPDIAGYAAELDTYEPADTAKANALLKEAGFDGVSFSYLCMNDESINEEDWCQGIGNMISRAGFKPDIDMGPRAVQSPKRTKGETDVFNISWANEPTLDAFSLLSQVLMTKEGAFGVSNYGGWSVPELDALVMKAADATDPAERLELERQALKIAKEQVLMVPLHQQPIAWATKERITEVDLRADNKPRHWFTVVGN